MTIIPGFNKKFYLTLILVFTMAAGSLWSMEAKIDAVHKDITPQEAADMIEKNKDNPGFVLLDVRTPNEFKSGHLKNAVLINYSASDFMEKIAKLDKNKTYLLYCRSGNRSSRAMKKIKAQGFIRTYNMKGGITQWQKLGYQIVTD